MQLSPGLFSSKHRFYFSGLLPKYLSLIAQFLKQITTKPRVNIPGLFLHLRIRRFKVACFDHVLRPPLLSSNTLYEGQGLNVQSFRISVLRQTKKSLSAHKDHF